MTATMQTQCCVCHALKQPDGTWQPHVGLVYCSHGFCPQCAAIEMAKIDRLLRHQTTIKEFLGPEICAKIDAQGKMFAAVGIAARERTEHDLFELLLDETN
jgi:hypothetical protein